MGNRAPEVMKMVSGSQRTRSRIGLWIVLAAVVLLIVIIAIAMRGGGGGGGY